MSLNDISLGILVLASSTLLTSCSSFLRVSKKLPKGNLLVLKHLSSLLRNITRMTAVSLAIYVEPNLLRPAQDWMLPLDVLVEVTGMATFTDSLL